MYVAIVQLYIHVNTSQDTAKLNEYCMLLYYLPMAMASTSQDTAKINEYCMVLYYLPMAMASSAIQIRTSASLKCSSRFHAVNNSPFGT